MAAPADDRLRTVARVLTRLAEVALVGLFLGLAVAVVTPAHTEIAGSDTRVWLEPGKSYDQFGVDNVLTGRRATSRTVLGEPVGVRVALDLDPSVFTDESGQFNADILPAYIQAYSDPQQLISDVQRALAQHLAVFAAVGAGAAVLIAGGWRGYRAWRRSYDRAHWADGTARAVALAYRAPERRVARRVVIGMVIVAAVAVVPSGAFQAPRPAHVTGDALFDGTPLAGIQVEGLLRPALFAAQNYIETYFDQTNAYYDELRKKLDAYLAADPVQLPGATGTDTSTVVDIGFVTDRHCNIGMDRVIVALLKHYRIHTLVSAGDDAFSGSFGFESACTRNLADKSARAGITDVFVGGNHDSPSSLAEEAKQGIKTLDGKIVGHDGLHFLGLPDPRTSRYGQGIVPPEPAAQEQLLQQQGTTIGRTACALPGPIIAVVHDPLGGTTALQHGCGHITLTLDGHTHQRSGPNAIPLPDGRVGYQFTGGSTGGAPGEGAIERTFASRLTVGPLNHDASVNIISVDRATGVLVGTTSFDFTPDQVIAVDQKRVTS